MQTTVFEKTTVLRNVQPTQITAELARYDRLGHEAYCAAVGANPSAKHTYYIVHGGKSYPSKLIVAGVTNRNPSAFSGGISHIGLPLLQKGFLFQQLGFGFLSTVAPTASLVANPAAIGVTGEVEAYFASGSNRAADIRGFTFVGHSVMAVADKVSPATEAELYDVARTNANRKARGRALIQVGIDSGAFSEVDKQDIFKTVAPMTHAKWQKVLDLYNRLALVFAEYGVAESLHLIAPDKIADQAETLVRLARYKAECRALAAMGVRVMVVAQKGRQTQVEFAQACLGILGADLSWSWALPCKKGATSPAEAGTFVAAMQPERLHLLGLGTGNAKFDAFMGAILAGSPRTVVTCDSCWLAANAGHARGAGQARPLTRARVWAEQLIEAGKAHTKVVHELAIVLALTGGLYQAMLF